MAHSYVWLSGGWWVVVDIVCLVCCNQYIFRETYFWANIRVLCIDDGMVAHGNRYSTSISNHEIGAHFNWFYLECIQFG